MGKAQRIKIVPGSIAHQAYGQGEVTEQFVCNYGLDPEFSDKIETGQLKITGRDLDGGVRIVEGATQQFYVGTLFQPQISSEPNTPHPLIVALLKAAKDR